MTVATGVACTACGGGTPSPGANADLLENGWVMDFENFGYYGGFTDDVDVLLGDRKSRNWHLCHDCIVKLLNLFPALAKTINAGQHPSEEIKPCCDFAWRLKEGGACCQYSQFGEWLDIPSAED